MSNALHDYAKLFERYAANNGGTGAILAGEDCLALANEMRMDADAIDAENAKLRQQLADVTERVGQVGKQCAKLRELATKFDEIQSGATRAVRVSLDSGSVLRDAAETLCDLRNRCNNLVDERERLFRANVEKNGKILRLVKENAELRKLALDFYDAIDSVFWDGETKTKERFKPRMHELGIEVDS